MTGEDVDADDWSKLGAETPDELIKSIKKLESEDPTENEIAHKNKNKDS